MAVKKKSAYYGKSNLEDVKDVMGVNDEIEQDISEYEEIGDLGEIDAPVESDIPPIEEDNIVPESQTELFNKIIDPDQIVRTYVPEIPRDLILTNLTGRDKYLIELFLDFYGMLKSMDLDYIEHGASKKEIQEIIEGKRGLPMDRLRQTFAYHYFGRVAVNRAERGLTLNRITTRRSEIETRQVYAQRTSDRKRKIYGLFGR